MVYLEKVNIKNKQFYKVTHVEDCRTMIKRYFNDKDEAIEYAKMYSKKRNCDVDSSIIKKNKKSCTTS